MAQGVNTAQWFETYVRRSYEKGWVNDDGSWLIQYGASLLGLATARIIVRRVQEERTA